MLPDDAASFRQRRYCIVFASAGQRSAIIATPDTMSAIFRYASFSPYFRHYARLISDAFRFTPHVFAIVLAGQLIADRYYWPALASQPA
jgi:hypothetical protein